MMPLISLRALDQRLLRRLILGGRRTPGCLTRFEGGSFYALPDTTYFAESIDLTGGKVLRLAGPIPKARFWSITLYDRIGRPVKSLIDEEIPEREGNFSLRIGNVPRSDPDYIYCPKLSYGMVIVRIVRPNDRERLEAPCYGYETE